MSDEPRGDYLWDRSGDEDAQLRDLERLLARYRHGQPLRIPGDESEDEEQDA